MSSGRQHEVHQMLLFEKMTLKFTLKLGKNIVLEVDNHKSGSLCFS